MCINNCIYSDRWQGCYDDLIWDIRNPLYNHRYKVLADPGGVSRSESGYCVVCSQCSTSREILEKQLFLRLREGMLNEG